MTAPTVVAPFAEPHDIDAAVAEIIADVHAHGMRVAPEGIRNLRAWIEAMAWTHVIDGVRYSRMPDGVIREVAEH
jgi:hypothetical protein